MHTHFLPGLCLMLTCLWGGSTSAHPISITDAYILVDEHKLEVRLEVFVEDLYLFHQLPLTEQNALPPDAVTRGTKLHEEFLKERFKILTGDGHRLVPETSRVNSDDVPMEAIPFPNLMNYKLFYEFTYPLTEPPEYLTFIQDFTRENSLLPSELEIKVKPPRGRRFQQLLLPNQPWTIHLTGLTGASADEQDLPPAERFERMRQEKLGITSYGATYAFLYLEKNEIRLETLIPLATLTGSLNMDLQADSLLDLEKQQALREPIQQKFFEQIRLVSGNQPLNPTLRRIDFFGVAFRDFSLRAEPRPVSIANARVGVILSFPRNDQQVSGQLEWNLFNAFLYQVNLAVITAAGAESLALRQIESGNLYQWEYPQLDSTPPESSPATSLPSGDLDQLAVDVPVLIPIREISLGILLACLLALIGARGASRRGPASGAPPSSLQRFFPLATLLCGSVLVLLLGLFAFTPLGEPPSRLMPPQQQATISELLLDHVYAAFNQRNEEAIFDRLDEVVDGPLLRDLYLEIRRSMTMEEQGGALARAGRVTLLECLPDDATNRSGSERFAETFTCRWRVPGTVEHWGHIHSRTTEYLADITLAPRETGAERTQWKLVAVELRNQDQSIMETSVRQF